MAKVNEDVTRRCIRFLGTADGRTFNCESRNEQFCFACFFGKDTRLRLEKNLMSFDSIGERGWLYSETKHLVDDLKVHLTLSGDTPWLNRLTSATIQSDASADSCCVLWMPNPDADKLQSLLARHKGLTTAHLKELCSEQVQDESCNSSCTCSLQSSFK